LISFNLSTTIGKLALSIEAAVVKFPAGHAGGEMLVNQVKPSSLASHFPKTELMAIDLFILA
jgi:hypothetical protein